MKTLIASVLPLLLWACVDPGAGSLQTVDGMRMQVAVEDVFWPATTADRVARAEAAKAGEDYGVEPFPWMSALVVSRRDGRAMGPADETRAYGAVSAHCAAKGWPVPPPEAILTRTGWAFLLCGP